MQKCTICGKYHKSHQEAFDKCGVPIPETIKHAEKPEPEIKKTEPEKVIERILVKEKVNKDKTEEIEEDEEETEEGKETEQGQEQTGLNPIWIVLLLFIGIIAAIVAVFKDEIRKIIRGGSND